MDTSQISRRDFLRLTGVAGVGAVAFAMIGGCTTRLGADTEDDASDQAPKFVTQGKLTAVGAWIFPPFEYANDETGEPEGFDIDVVTELASRMGLEPVFLPSEKFDEVGALIEDDGKADIAISAITITNARAEQFDFTDPYLNSNQGLVTRKEDYKGYTDDELREALNERSVKVVTQAGTTGADWVDENLPNATHVSVDDPGLGMTGLAAGTYDACVSDLPVTLWMCSKAFQGLHVAMEIPTGEQYGIMVAKDNRGLTAVLNGVLADIKSDGTMAKLEKKWFGSII